MDWEDPNNSKRTSLARNLDRDPIRELHQGQRPYAPHQRAGHMTASDQVAKTMLKPLARGGRPRPLSDMRVLTPAERIALREALDNPSPLKWWQDELSTQKIDSMRRELDRMDEYDRAKGSQVKPSESEAGETPAKGRFIRLFLPTRLIDENSA